MSSHSKPSSESAAPATTPAGPQRAPFSHGFWDPEIAPIRRLYLLNLFRGSLLALIAMMAMFPIYWGALWSTPEQTHKLNGWIVNQEGNASPTAIGNLIEQRFLELSRTYRQLTWTSRDITEAEAENALVQNQAWAIIYIRPGATEAVTAAQTTATARTSFNPAGFVEVYLNQARNEQAYGTYIMPAIQEPISRVLAQFAATQARALAGNAGLADLLTSAPQLLTSPLQASYNNLRPYDIPVATAITFVGSIYLAVLSFILVMTNFGVRQPLEAKLTTAALIKIRVAVPIILYFIFSIFFALISYAFQADFSRKFGSSGFVIYIMLCWIGFCALGLALEAMVTLLTPRFVPFFLLLLIISNVSVALLPPQLQPSVYQYGYAFPFYNISQAVRCILFRTRDQLGLNFGVLLAWVAVSLITLPTFVWITRRSQVRNAQREHEEKLAREESGEKATEDTPDHEPRQVRQD